MGGLLTLAPLKVADVGPGSQRSLEALKLCCFLYADTPDYLQFACRIDN